MTLSKAERGPAPRGAAPRGAATQRRRPTREPAEPDSKYQPGPDSPGPAANALAKPLTALRPADVLTLQRSVGNRAATRLLANGPAQPAPHISLTGPVIQRSLGKKWQANNGIQHSTGLQWFAPGPPEVDSETQKVKHELMDPNGAQADRLIFEDDPDFDWVIEPAAASSSSMPAAASSSSNALTTQAESADEEPENVHLPLRPRPSAKV